jgi:hypothetical protein
MQPEPGTRKGLFSGVNLRMADVPAEVGRPDEKSRGHEREDK